MRIHKLTVGPFQTNCYIVENGKDCFVVDPGGDAELILEEIQRIGCEPRAIVATHAHFDHVMGVKPLKVELGIPFLMHRDDMPILLGQPMFVKQFWGFELPDMIDRVDRFIDEGDILDSTIRVIHTPGHSPGSITLAGSDFLIVGDVIFKDGYGRTDLPGGDERLLIKSIMRILSYPEDTIVYPGHGPETTVGYLKKVTNWL